MTDTLPTLRYEIGASVVPGDRIGTIRQVLPGVGTYNRGGHIYASLTGSLKVKPVELPPPTSSSLSSSSSTQDTTMNTDDMPKFQCCIHKATQPNATSQVLSVGQLVLGRVIRIANHLAFVHIPVAEAAGVLHGNGHDACIRMEDVRTTNTASSSNDASSSSDKDAVFTMDQCFQPNDVVLARVVAMGDMRRYFLSTSEPQLGVIHAVSATSQQPMIPVSWKEMECPETGIREGRKCAKPVSA